MEFSKEKKKSNCSLLVLEIVGGREGFLEEVGLGPWSLQPLIHLVGLFHLLAAAGAVQVFVTHS